MTIIKNKNNCFLNMLLMENFKITCKQFVLFHTIIELFEICIAYKNLTKIINLTLDQYSIYIQSVWNLN